MAWKFLNIGKANAEIERLTAENAKLTTERDEAETALEPNSSEIVLRAESLQAQLTDVNAEKATLKGQITSLEASLANTQIELQAAQEKLANPTAQIVAIASHTAAEITGAQGQPPIPAAPAGSPEGGAAAGSSKDLMAQINAIQDPTARTMFYRKNKAAFMAASRADRK